jgi:hypothetical protein
MSNEQSGVSRNVILVILILGGMMWLVTTVKSYTELGSMPGDTVPKTAGAATQDDISSTIGYVASIVHDVNKDNLVNCIDYAVLFYKYFPGECVIIVNRNRNTGMHHLFNAVWIARKWIYLEPQGPQSNYDMSSVWGKKYNPYYNAVVTASWAVYAK